jgi:hypothetical protein
MNNHASYAVDAAYSPGDIGGVYINITPTRKILSEGKLQIDNRYLEVEATI